MTTDIHNSQVMVIYMQTIILIHNSRLHTICFGCVVWKLCNYLHIISGATRRTIKRWTGVGDRTKINQIHDSFGTQCSHVDADPHCGRRVVASFSPIVSDRIWFRQKIIINDIYIKCFLSKNVRLRRRCAMWMVARILCPASEWVNAFIVFMRSDDDNNSWVRAWVCVSAWMHTHYDFMYKIVHEFMYVMFGYIVAAVTSGWTQTAATTRSGQNRKINK